MIGRIPHWFLIVGIVTIAFGCDNVSWGGMDLSLEGPPGDTVPSVAGGSEGDPAPLPQIGPLLYAAVRQGDSAFVVPVGGLTDQGLQPLPPGDLGEALGDRILEDRLRPGTELTLFHQGIRAGTLVVNGPGSISSDYCSPRPETRGVLELVPGAIDAQRFLALEKPQGMQRTFGTFEPLTIARAHRIAIQNLAGEALNEVGAQWPGSLEDIRQDFQVFLLPEEEGPSVVASFIHQDRLGVSPAPENAYSLLVLGEAAETRWQRTFTWFRPVSEEGKGAPRFFSHLDWDGDGFDEILLEVFGSESRWWAALGREAGEWRVTFQDPCGMPGTGEGSQ